MKNGDQDAHPPGASPPSLFQVIPGCSSFSVKGNRVVLAPEIFGKDTLSFLIPGGFQTRMLERAIRIAKFEIFRRVQESSENGSFWISLSYEIETPEPVPFVPEDAVFIALGASSIGIISPKGEETIPLWRADTKWKPLTDALEASLARPKDAPGYARPLIKGSNRSERLKKKRRIIFRKMGAQQKQDRREVVAVDLVERDRGPKRLSKAERRFRTRHVQQENRNQDPAIRLLGHGVHFVVTELVIRSKEGKLADASKPERGGSLGANWSAQNTGSIGYLVQWLEGKVREYGGSVRKHSLPFEALPEPSTVNDEQKILMARALRDDFLKSVKTAAAA